MYTDAEIITDLYYKAAIKGDAEGLFCYGCRLKNGMGIDRNVDLGISCIIMAARKGNNNVMVWYGIHRLTGTEDVLMDKNDAVRLFKLAADNGSYYGTRYYSLCLQNGDGVQKDKKMAAKYTNMAKKNPDKKTNELEYMENCGEYYIERSSCCLLI